MPIPDNDTRIKKLSPLLINQLAAGEVVTRPAAVIKELLENAIDAGASNIEVYITQGGMGMIEVADDGYGIHPDDMIMAITRHATSKVADVANLHGVTTLGFRGEALAATAAVSRLTLASSHDHSGVGRQLQVAGVLDDVPTLTPVVQHQGTTVTVKDLYFNVPARRGNLKSIATEFGHIETVVREVAIARADVALTLFHDNKKRLALAVSTVDSHKHINPSPLPLSRLEQATGTELIEQSIEVAVDLSSLIQQSKTHHNSINYDNQQAETSPSAAGLVQESSAQASIRGWLWPSTEANHVLPKLIYINGRLVKEPLISNQLRQHAQRARLAGLGYALYFQLPTSWLNVNVHPSKQRIKISPLNNVMAYLNHSVHTMLKNNGIGQVAQQPDNKRLDGDTYTSKTADISGSDHDRGPDNDRRPDNNSQVQSAKQAYQPSASKQLPKGLVNTSNRHSVDQDVCGTDYDDVTAFSETVEVETEAETLYKTSKVYQTNEALPVCLDIIRDTTAMDAVKGQTPPWLLFYSRGRCVLIGADRWQQAIKRLLQTLTWSSELVKKGTRQADTIPNSAAEINQQIAKIGATMSAQDRMAFVMDIDELLNDKAIKIISSQQMVALMLSSDD